MIKTNVLSCARCGEDHVSLEFEEFTRTPIEDSDGTIWNFWAMCPTTNEPILLKAKQQEND